MPGTCVSEIHLFNFIYKLLNSMKDVSLEICALRGTLKQLSWRFTRNPEESSDLVQDTLLKAFTYRDKYREDTNLQGWLFTIMRNTFINTYRKNQKEASFRDKTRELYFLNVEDEHTSPEKEFRWNELWSRIDSIDENLKTPFKLHNSGYRYHEIAEQLNIPIGTVKNRIFQARKEIQKQMA